MNDKPSSLADEKMNEDMPLVTVGLASYNRPQLLKRAIESIRAQTYKNLEILISDNGSTETEVLHIIDEFAQTDPRVTCFLNSPNRGAFFNFRLLLSKASGRFFVWLADDDYWSNEFIEDLLQNAIKSGAVLTYGRAVVVDVLLPDGSAVAKEMPTTKSGIASLIAFVCIDSDSFFYGLFETRMGKRCLPVLRDWVIPASMANIYPFLKYNFVSYVFLYGLLSSGGFCNASSERAIHYCGGRPPYHHSSKLGFQHIELLIMYVLIHAQMLIRIIRVSLATGNIIGTFAAPCAALYFFCRRLYLIISLRVKMIVPLIRKSQ